MHIEQKQDRIFKPNSIYTLSAEETNQQTTELEGLISHAGLTPSASDLTQVSQAVDALIDEATPIATSSTIGLVKPDNETVTVASDGTLTAVGGGTGSGKQIGEVFYSQSSSAQDNAGALPLFTGETIANADELYPDFYQWVATHTELQISAADYETAITTYGECPKYVIDTVNKSIRLPLLKNYVKFANTTDGITQSGAGLPNITAGVIWNGCGGSTTKTSGAWRYNASPITSQSGSGITYGGVDFDASRSSSIYGNSNTVTPAHTTLYPWVCAYNAAIPASTAQAAQFQQSLTGKADTNLSNVTGTSGFRKLVEVYNNGTSWYKVFDEYDPVTGAFIGKWCEQGGLVVNITPNQWTFVALLKEYADTNYTVIGSGVDPSVSTSNPDQFFAYRSPLQTTGFYGGFRYLTGSSAFTDRGFSWHACGYLATES